MSAPRETYGAQTTVLVWTALTLTCADVWLAVYRFGGAALRAWMGA